MLCRIWRYQYCNYHIQDFRSLEKKFCSSDLLPAVASEPWSAPYGTGLSTCGRSSPCKVPKLGVPTWALCCSTCSPATEWSPVAVVYIRIPSSLLCKTKLIHIHTYMKALFKKKKRLQVLDRSNYDLMGPNKKIPDRPPVTDSPPEVRRSQRVLTPTTGLSAQLIKRHARLRQTSKFQNPGCFGLRESVNNNSHNPRQRGAAREDHRQEEEKHQKLKTKTDTHGRRKPWSMDRRDPWPGSRCFQARRPAQPNRVKSGL